MHECVDRLFKQLNAKTLKCLCQLLTTVGKEMDAGEEKVNMESLEGYKYASMLLWELPISILLLIDQNGCILQPVEGIAKGVEGVSVDPNNDKEGHRPEIGKWTSVFPAVMTCWSREAFVTVLTLFSFSEQLDSTQHYPEWGSQHGGTAESQSTAV